MADLIKKNIKLTEINERVSETEYNVIYPKTTAGQVITDKDKQFVTEAEKNTWNEIAEYGLKYRGAYSSSAQYEVHDVVVYEGRYYVCLMNNTNQAPSETGDTTIWANLNKEAELASKADKVNVTGKTTGEYSVTLVAGTNGYKEVYYDGKDTGLLYNIETGTLTVAKVKGNLEGTASKATEADHATNADKADVADKFVEYEHTIAEDGTITRGAATGKTPVISTTIVELREAIKDVQGGGTHLSNALTINKDGQQEVVFDGLTAATVDIKQTYSTADITDLLENTKTKIDTKWLPDSILGQLEYQGVWDPSTDSNKEAQKGYYYIANASGTINPDNSTSGIEYNVGDWAVYNGTSWDKVDNTDAVTMVNGQKGAVETYKGEWATNSVYYKGDIVKKDGVLYIRNVTADSAEAEFVEASWDIFGRIYGASDGIKLDGTTFKHDVTLEEGTTTETTLTKDGGTIDVQEVVRDAYGHVTKVNIKKITLGSDFIDTVRPVQVKGTEILTKDSKNTAINFVDGNKIKVSNTDNAIKFDHETSALGEKVFGSAKVTDTAANDDILYSGQGYSIPTFTVDAYGHVIAGEMKRFRIADALVKHNHFNITKDAAGAQVIEAYSASVADEAWVANADNKLKFYLGDVNPSNTSKMNFNGHFNATQLQQKGNIVLDRTVKIGSGNGSNGAALYGTYNAGTNSIDLANSGVAAGAYSVVKVNDKGIVTAGGQIVEFGQTVGAGPSESLAVGGLFFRLISEPTAA